MHPLRPFDEGDGKELEDILQTAEDYSLETETSATDWSLVPTWQFLSITPAAHYSRELSTHQPS